MICLKNIKDSGNVGKIQNENLGMDSGNINNVNYCCSNIKFSMKCGD